MSTRKAELEDLSHRHRRGIRLRSVLKIAGTLWLLLLLTIRTRAQCAFDSFDPNPNDAVSAIAVQPDGKILIGGNFNLLSPNGGPPVARYHLARLNADGTLDMAFDCNVNCNTNGNVYSIVVQGDGKVLIAGGFTSVGGQLRRYIARLDGTTGAVDSFDPNANSSIEAIAVQGDGQVLAGGAFTSIGGQTRNKIARLDATSGLADSFDPNGGTGIFGVHTIVLQADGKILVGGGFGSIGGQTRRGIARLDPNTGLPDSFNPNASSTSSTGPYVASIAVQEDSKILVGGNFTSIGGQQRRRIARLDATTGMADSFDPNALGSAGNVGSIVVQPDGKILAGGVFTSIGGQPRIGIARLDPNTALADSFNPNPSSFVQSIALQADGKILATGNFSSMSGQPRNYIAQLDPGCTATPTPIPMPSKLGNISTRLRVLSGDNALIGGLIVTGGGFKRVIIRAIGPSLTGFGVPGALENPTLDLFQGSTLLFSNDDWNNSTQQAEIAKSGLAPSNAAESAILWTLFSGQNYTAVVRGQSGATGVGIVEAYDLDQTAFSTKLGNISTRGFVDVDDNVMIAGLIVAGNGTTLKVLVRALGPTLGDFGVAGALANPTLDLVNASGTVIRSNNDWKDDPQQRAQIEAAGLAPGHDEEAALVETVTPGAYTAIVRGSGRATGVGLVEAYNIP